MKKIILVAVFATTTVLANAQSAKHKLPVSTTVDTVKIKPVVKKVTAGPLAYKELITAEAKSQKGFFNVHRLNDKYYFELPDSLLNRDILIINRIVTANAGSGYYADDQIGPEKVIRFRKGPKNTITLNTISYSVYAKDSTSQMFTAVNNSNIPTVSETFDIKALAKDSKGSIIELTDLLVNGGSIVNGRANSINTVNAHPGSIEVAALRLVSAKGSGGSGGSGGTMEMNSSLILLPKVPMKARYFDERVGFFTTGYTDFDADKQGVKNVNLICRWRMEPKPEDMEKYKRGELVEPQKPIVFYIDPATPKKWVPYIMKGVDDWQAAFEKAGFKHAIYAKTAPTKAQDSTWSLEACTAAIIYKASSTKNAEGPNIHDPRSGEIIQSHVNWYHNIMKLIHNMYVVQASPNDPRARKNIFDDELMGQLIRVISSHEVGHTLGLKHNLGASSTVPVEKLRDKKWVEANGHTPSIMDYARFNYVAQPGDGVTERGLFPRIGDYDKWAIEWGYKVLPQYKNADDEMPYLNTWIRKELDNPRLWWGDGEDGQNADPRSQAEDVGNDAVKAGEYGIKNLQYIIPNLISWTSEGSDNFDNLADLYQGIAGRTGQFSLYVGHVVNIVGGRYRTPYRVEDNKAVYEFVPKNKQKDAVAFLNKEVFATPRWLLDPKILNGTGFDPLTIISDLQNNAFNTLFIPNRINNLFSAEATLGNDSYKMVDLIEDLRKGIWTELTTHEPIDIYRRKLQNNYFATLSRMLTNRDDSALAGIIRGDFLTLQQDATAALAASKDVATQYHLQDLLDRLDTVLKNQSNLNTQKTEPSFRPSQEIKN